MTTTPGKDPLSPIHPGEMLREEFLAPLDLSPGALASAIGVPRTRIERLVKEEVALTADTALRLARYFGTSAEMWTGLQARFDIETTRDTLAPVLATITPRASASQSPAARKPRGRKTRAA